MESNLQNSLDTLFATLKDISNTKHERKWMEDQRDSDQFEHDVAIREVALETAMDLISYKDHHGQYSNPDQVIGIALKFESFLRGETEVAE